MKENEQQQQRVDQGTSGDYAVAKLVEVRSRSAPSFPPPFIPPQVIRSEKRIFPPLPQCACRGVHSSPYEVTRASVQLQLHH